MKKTVSTFLLVLGIAAGGICGSTTGSPSASDVQLHLPKGLSPESQREKADWAERQKAVDQIKADARPTLDYLKTDADSKSQDAKIAQVQVDDLKKDLLYAKNLDPRDPWREIHGEKKYVMSLGAGIVQFRGQVEDATTNGIRVLGQMGDATGVEYFVVNFPYPLEAGENIDPTKIFVAFEDGTYTYENDDGYNKTIPKLNYGKSCARPLNADAIELAAQKLTPDEEAQIKSAESDAADKLQLAQAAQKRFQDFQARVDADWKSAAEKLRQDRERALRLTQERAAKGDAQALRRMAERYRDGDEVEKNPFKAAEYFQRAEAAPKPAEPAATNAP